MRLADYYLGDPRLVLVPIEHLTPAGMTPAFAALLAARRGWTPAQTRLLDAGFALYWERSAALAARTPTWLAPRLRHVAVVRDPLAVRPYVQLLNTSAWMLYESDVDPAGSSAEFVAYLLVHGDRLAVSRQVATAAVQTAAWWLERSDAECAAFAAAAAGSRRPDAAAFQAVAAALPWLRRLHHETVRVPRIVSPHRPIPATGLLVPAALENEPPALAARCADVARTALAAYRAAWRSPAGNALATIADWLAGEAPRVLVTGEGGRIVWDPDTSDRVADLRAELRDADAVAVEAIADDLRVIDRHTRVFQAALVDPGSLPAPRTNTDQSGYSYLHAERRLIAYNLREPGMERLVGTPLPWARAMLGARTAHEWAHLVEAAGWVPRTVDPERWAALKAALAAEIDAAIAAAPPAIRARTAPDLARLAGEGSAGAALVRLLLTRMPDYKANLIVRRFATEEEKETYVRHNVRTLRYDYPSAELWRALIRYLYEYQYLSPALGLTAMGDPRTYFLRSTWFADDFLATRVLDDARFDALAACVGDLCACYAVDEGRFRAAAARG